ncbi:Uncharacterised protein [Mycobacteroides abscessus subsp. abscessus]|nr:Uncharacterised protein [Mycobacteroides abscessus subsp. abscessus]SHZ88840.1 Uncharacterised protein [Mycobacteroides abscessus subsp. abscessus]SKV42755.1 Uncharacterised protein [Mycobacteroides abscessus subsp. abscessus]
MDGNRSGVSLQVASSGVFCYPDQPSRLTRGGFAGLAHAYNTFASRYGNGAAEIRDAVDPALFRIDQPSATTSTVTLVATPACRCTSSTYEPICLM